MSDAALAALQPRGNEILDQIRGTFAEKGFDGASMQDLARAAGMSVGNFYRYFPSKAALVEAIILRDMDLVRADFEDVLAAPDPMARLREVLHRRIKVETCKADPSLWAEITAMAHRRPEVAAICIQMEAEIIRLLIGVIARVRGLALPEAEARFGAHAGLIVLLVKSWALEDPGKLAATSGLEALLLKTIERTLDEIASACPKG